MHIGHDGFLEIEQPIHGKITYDMRYEVILKDRSLNFYDAILPPSSPIFKLFDDIENA